MSRRLGPGRRHGTRACYVWGPQPGRGKGCRCFPCRVANAHAVQVLADGRRRPYRVRWIRTVGWEVREFDGARDGKTVCRTPDREEAYRVRDERNRRHARRDPVWLDGGEVRDVRAHIRRMVAAGLGLKGIARAAGVNVKTVTMIHLGYDPVPDRDRGQGYRPRFHRGGPRRVRRATGEAILAVTLSDASDGHKVDGGPTWDLLEVLFRAGYPKAQVAQALGRKGPGLQIRRDRVRASTVREVRDLYERLYRENPRVRLAAEGFTFRRRIRALSHKRARDRRATPYRRRREAVTR